MSRKWGSRERPTRFSAISAGSSQHYELLKIKGNLPKSMSSTSCIPSSSTAEFWLSNQPVDLNFPNFHWEIKLTWKVGVKYFIRILCVYTINICCAFINSLLLAVEEWRMFVAFLGQEGRAEAEAEQQKISLRWLLLFLSFLLQDSYIALGNYTFIYQELSLCVEQRQ